MLSLLDHSHMNYMTDLGKRLEESEDAAVTGPFPTVGAPQVISPGYFLTRYNIALGSVMNVIT